MNNFLSNLKNKIHWCGEIPSYWEVSKFKYVFSEKKSTKNSILNSGSISYGRVIYKNDEKISESTKNSYQEVLSGEFLINPLNLNYDLKSLRIALSGIDAVVSQGYIVLQINEGYYPDYFKYLLRKFDVEHMKSLGQGVRQTISFNDIKNEYLIIPPVNEQKLISKFLNKKTKKIDQLIERIEKKIKLIQEQKSSVINQYITKGLNNNSEMKESGIAWIGKIPCHWKILPAFKLFYENKIKNKEERKDVLTLSYGKLKYRDLSNLDGLVPSSFENYQVINVQSIVIRSTDLQNDKKSLRVGHAGIPGVITSAYLGLNPFEEINTKFFYYSMHLADLKKVFYCLGGGLRQSLRFDDFKRFPIIVPPEDERNKIATILDNLDKKNNDLISHLRREIILLEEYRHSLISHSVTGKIQITEDML